jgi:hypothetical protein
MAKKLRRYKGAQEKALNEFLNEIIGVTSTGSRRAMVAMAQRGIRRLVNNVAGFSDYTGVLINSYQAALYSRGKFQFSGGRGGLRGREGYKGDFYHTGDPIRNYGNTFRSSTGSAILFTSYGIGPKGTKDNPISFKTVKNKGESIEKSYGRNSSSKETIPNRWKRRPKEYLGYGRKTANVKSYNPSVKLGFEVVFDNPTPYAMKVHKENKGSTVMPVGTSQIMGRGLAFSITSQEIGRELYKAKRRQKK